MCALRYRTQIQVEDELTELILPFVEEPVAPTMPCRMGICLQECTTGNPMG
jgi:hypothetical protein